MYLITTIIKDCLKCYRSHCQSCCWFFSCSLRKRQLIPATAAAWLLSGVEALLLPLLLPLNGYQHIVFFFGKFS